MFKFSVIRIFNQKYEVELYELEILQLLLELRIVEFVLFNVRNINFGRFEFVFSDIGDLDFRSFKLEIGHIGDLDLWRFELEIGNIGNVDFRSFKLEFWDVDLGDVDVA